MCCAGSPNDGTDEGWSPASLLSDASWQSKGESREGSVCFNNSTNGSDKLHRGINGVLGLLIGRAVPLMDNLVPSFVTLAPPATPNRARIVNVDWDS